MKKTVILLLIPFCISCKEKPKPFTYDYVEILCRYDSILIDSTINSQHIFQTSIKYIGLKILDNGKYYIPVSVIDSTNKAYFGQLDNKNIKFLDSCISYFDNKKLEVLSDSINPDLSNIVFLIKKNNKSLFVREMVCTGIDPIFKDWTKIATDLKNNKKNTVKDTIVNFETRKLIPIPKR